MPPLPSDLRSQLERTVVAARDTAEKAARAALVILAVERDEPYPSLNEDQRRLRRALRAVARQRGGGTPSAGIPLLVEQIAYQQWHRMLFARFLAENDLLMHPQGVPVSLDDCAELAPEEGAADAWELATRYAGRMLPGIFTPDDPTAQVRLAPEHRHALEALVQALPAAVFLADDALGWVYQFWQTKRKAEVNASEVKIGAAELPAVTQLFTEDYMVRFLLENSLGAWWAARRPDSPLLADWQYLRYLDDAASPPGRPRVPAAGTFPGWPEHAAQVTVMDPSGGSGHFILVAFDLLRRMRIEEEGLDAAAAAEAVIRDNLYMLEIDPRCTQIAAFALLFAAWKAVGYRQLPVPHIACSGIAVEGQLEDWLKLADGNARQRATLTRLYHLFRQAPTLGSLIDPAHTPIEERMFEADYDEVAPLFERALSRERQGDDPAALVLGQAAQGVARAASLLARRYTLVTTNVPYLGRGRQDEGLKAYCEERYPLGKADLATCFLERCRAFSAPGGSYALVTPQNWLFLRTYQSFREMLLREQAWGTLAVLGEHGFESSQAAGAFTALYVLTNAWPEAEALMTGVEADAGEAPQEKARLLREAPVLAVRQADQLRNPDARITLSASSNSPLLSRYGYSYKGITSGDDPRYRRCFWEMPAIETGWRLLQSTVSITELYGGCEHVLRLGEMVNPQQPGVYIRAEQTWGKRGIAVSQMRALPCALSLGEPFDTNTAVIVPHDPAHLPAIWAYCSSPDYARDVRRIDKKLNVTNATLVKVPFDLARWQKVAEEAGPLPEPHSNDPTQWLFAGRPVGSTAPLQVAVARLLGYRWPQQDAGSRHSEGRPRPEESRPDAPGDSLDALSDPDGIVCLPPVAGELPAAERLRALLAAAYQDAGHGGAVTGAWSLARQQALLAEAGYGGKGLDDWLRDGFFAQHCKLFHNRPFLWHIWDGRADGFAALANYHKLDGPALDKLIYTYLGAWIETQRAERERGVAAADGRLVAALELRAKLVAIRDGEPPYDIYVRWKPLHEQPIGWHPDLNDGVRLNIRPFVVAGVLRSRFSIHWKKDRGKNPDGSERINDLHYTRAEKRKARDTSSR